MELRRHLKQLMDTHGITVTGLAKQSGIPKQTIHDWLTGAEPRRISQVKKVADVLRVTVDALVFGPIREQKLVPSVLVTEPDGWIKFVGEIKIRPVNER